MLKPVLVFDSGIGGLTVLREARVLMPERGFIYVADDAGFPYGGWEEEALKARILSLFETLLQDYSPEVCIIACNTAFTLAGADLRARFPDMTFVGTVPAIKPAAERTRSGLVSVLATPGTVKRQYTRDLISVNRRRRCHVAPRGERKPGAPGRNAGCARGSSDEEAVRAEIAPCFIERRRASRTDIVVLACTHYPFLVNRMRKTGALAGGLDRSGRSDCPAGTPSGAAAAGCGTSRWFRFCRLHLRQAGFRHTATDAGFWA
ncbi:MAG: aspartate/glutamate racemase family protein [Agrobacterium sp.]|nr:aspartate/glutamate racemase family protein [Agrobacterium sp.]